MPRHSSHVGTFYRRVPVSGAQPQRQYGWQPAVYDVAVDVQLAAGKLEQLEVGRRATARFKAFAPTGTDVAVGYGLLLTNRRLPNGDLEALPLATRPSYEVTAAMDWGYPGDLELELETCREQFEIIE